MEGITVRHRVSCKTSNGGKCSCKPGYRAKVYVGGIQVTKTFPTLGAAKGWRLDQLSKEAFNSKRSIPLLDAAAKDLATDMKAGFTRTRNGQPFKMRVVLDYQANIRLHILPVLGSYRLNEITPSQCEILIRRMLEDGLNPATIHNAFKPLRVIFREAVRKEVIAENPLSRVRFPAANGKRERIAPIDQAKHLISQLPDPKQRAIWGCAFFAGLRRGEILGLQWEDVDLEAGELHISRAWCQKTNRMQSVKSTAGNRTVPVPKLLLDLLRDYRPHEATGLVFGTPNPAEIRRRAMYAWCPETPKHYKGEPKGDLPYSLQEARHTYVSILVRAGVDIRAAMTYSGHESIKVFMQTYAKLFPGSRQEDSKRLDDFLG